MAKAENDVVQKCQPKFYKRYVDHIINRRKKKQVDPLFNGSNNYHQNIRTNIS